MSEIEMKNDVETEEEFIEELSDEALDRTEDFMPSVGCARCMVDCCAGAAAASVLCKAPKPGPFCFSASRFQTAVLPLDLVDGCRKQLDPL